MRTVIEKNGAYAVQYPGRTLKEEDFIFSTYEKAAFWIIRLGGEK
jgi:hypothetical protein